MIHKFILAIMTVVLISAFQLQRPQQKGEWVAPKTADLIKNPLKRNINATAEGKKLYMRFCKTCHGTKGKGDGIAGVNLKPRPKDFTLQKVQQQSDGAIFWKITTGRTPMAGYEKILKKEQRWQLVNYIRELGKTTK